MVIVTLEDFNRACEVDVDVKQFVAPPELDADGNFIQKPAPPQVVDAAGNLIPGEEEPDVKANLKATEWADEVKVTLFGEGQILRTRDLLERQLEAYCQWVNTPEPPPPPKDPLIYIRRVQELKDIDQKVADGLQEKPTSDKLDNSFSEQQRKAYSLWQDSDVYQKYRLLQEEYWESLKPPPPPRDWSQKEYPGLLELQNEQFLKWYAANRPYLENLLKPEVPEAEIPIPPQTPPPPPKDVNIYIRNMEKMKEVEDYWKQKGPYVFWPDKYDPSSYYLELQRYWMSRWEYTEEYLILCRGVIRKKVKKIPWRVRKWWEWMPISTIYKEEREPTKALDYGGLPKKVLSSEYRGRGQKPEGDEEKPEGEGDETSITSSLVVWDTETKKPYKSVAYKAELDKEPTKMPENRILWEKEPRPINMDAIYKETYEIIVKTQPNFI